MIEPLFTVSDEKNNDPFSFLEKLLDHAEEALKSSHAVSIFNYSNERADSAVKHLTSKVCNNAFTSEAKQDEDKCRETDSCSNDYQNSNSLTSVKQSVQHSSLNTSTTSVSGSKARYNS